MSRDAPGDHQRQQREPGTERGHDDRHQALLGSTQHQRDAERHSLLVLELAIVADEHDAIPRCDAEDRDEPNEGAKGNRAASE